MKKNCLEIHLDEIESGLILFIYPESDAGLVITNELDTADFSESQYQILEGCAYEYYFNKDNYQLATTIKGIVNPSKIQKISSGRITPNIYVGTLSLDILCPIYIVSNHKLEIEVLATKFNKELDKSYRENYRFMLECITDKCTELLMQIKTPIHQTYEVNFDSNESTIYQRFCFVQSIINNSTFAESVERIIENPKANWKEETELTDIRKIKRINNYALRQMVTGSNRIKLPHSHPLVSYGIKSAPLRINNVSKAENFDTPENRFIKYVLEQFKQFSEKCWTIFNAFKMEQQAKEAVLLIAKLEGYLGHSFFKNINPPSFLKLNSPVLQKRNGYREILNRWLQFELASKLIWKGGDDVYKAGKKDIATLYEYWLFFMLYDLVKEKFEIESISHNDKAYKHLIEPTNDGLNVMLKSGKHTALSGIFTKGSRDLNIKFSYNRTFKGGVSYEGKKNGSWTIPLRPDYTLSIWPKILTEEQAEANESIVHIHFDAKYKVDNFYDNIKPNVEGDELEQELNQSDIDEKKGRYKNIDILKMHAYKDAIRRSGGAYILYPGAKEKVFRGFHEIIPGLGAFSVNPSSTNDDIKELSTFIDLIIDHLLDRTSQREKLSDETNIIFNEPKADYEVLHERIPEFIDSEKLIADKVFVLIGFYKDKDHLNWILKNNLYNLRTGTDRGSFTLSQENISAKYLILHGHNELETNKIYKLKTSGPKIYSQNDLIKKNYPTPKGELYVVYEIEREASIDFGDIAFDLRKLSKLESFRNSAMPIWVSLSEVLKTKKEISNPENGF